MLVIYFNSYAKHVFSDLFFLYTELYDRVNDEKLHAKGIDRKVKSFT